MRISRALQRFLRLFSRRAAQLRTHTATALSGPVRHNPESPARAAVHQLVLRRPFLPVLVLGVAALALLADGNPNDAYYEYATTISPPTVELTAEVPSVVLLVQLRARELSPNGLATTYNDSIDVVGTISSSGLDAAAGSQEVEAEVSPTKPLPPSSRQGWPLGKAISADTLAVRPWSEFTGSCDEILESDPCEFAFRLRFQRSDGGRGGGSVYVSWRLDLHASVSKDDQGPNEGPLELPWDVEVMPLEVMPLEVTP